MTPDTFRQLALSQFNARVATRLGVVECLVGEKVFATLGAPDPAFAVLKLAPADQTAVIASAPGVFSPQAGGAGARGATCVRLAMATPELLKPAMALAAAKARNARSAMTRLG